MAKQSITRISGKGIAVWESLKELSRSGDLLKAFSYRDLRVRYAQTMLGVAWALFQPVLSLVAVFVVFFKLAGIQSGGVPYPLFALSGLIFWNYFSFVTTQSALSLIHRQAMIKKIYFNRLTLPISKALVGLVDFAIAALLFVALAIYYDQSLIAALSFPLILLLTALSGLGLGMLTSAFSLRFRDLQQVLPFLMQFLFFLTPVAYPTAQFESLFSEKAAIILYLNPITGILELWRHWLFQSGLSDYCYLSIAMAFLLFFAGLVAFIRVDRKIADLI